MKCEDHPEFTVNGRCTACVTASAILMSKILFKGVNYQYVQPAEKHELAELAQWEEWAFALTFPTDYFTQIV